MSQPLEPPARTAAAIQNDQNLADRNSSRRFKRVRCQKCRKDGKACKYNGGVLKSSEEWEALLPQDRKCDRCKNTFKNSRQGGDDFASICQNHPPSLAEYDIWRNLSALQSPPKSRARISSKDWEQHDQTIVELRHERRTAEEIQEILKRDAGFTVSLSALKKRLADLAPLRPHHARERAGPKRLRSSSPDNEVSEASTGFASKRMKDGEPESIITTDDGASAGVHGLDALTVKATSLILPRLPSFPMRTNINSIDNPNVSDIGAVPVEASEGRFSGFSTEKHQRKQSHSESERTGGETPEIPSDGIRKGIGGASVAPAAPIADMSQSHEERTPITHDASSSRRIASVEGHHTGDENSYLIKLPSIRIQEPPSPDSGLTALHMAARFGQARVVQRLAEHSRQLLNQTTKHGRTALHFAVDENQEEVVRRLLQLPEINPAIADESGWTPLHIACRTGNLNIASLLLRAGENPYSDTVMISSLNVAIAFDQHDAFDFLFKTLQTRNPPVDWTKSRPWTSLHEAARRNNPRIAKTLILAGANVNYYYTRMQEKITPLHVSLKLFCKYGNHSRREMDSLVPPIISLFLLYGAVVNDRFSDGRNALHIAARWNLYGILQLFLEKCKLHDILAQDCRNLTPIHWAAYANSVNCIDLLVEAEAKNGGTLSQLEMCSQSGHTALHLATLRNNLEAVRCLIRRGAKIDTPDDHGQTSLVLAIRGGFKAAAVCLINAGADVNARDKQGRTPLIWAILRESQATLPGTREKTQRFSRHDQTQEDIDDIVDLLIGEGADLSATSEENPAGKPTAELAVPKFDDDWAEFIFEDDVYEFVECINPDDSSSEGCPYDQISPTPAVNASNTSNKTHADLNPTPFNPGQLSKEQPHANTIIGNPATMGPSLGFVMAPMLWRIHPQGSREGDHTPAVPVCAGCQFPVSHCTYQGKAWATANPPVGAKCDNCSAWCISAAKESSFSPTAGHGQVSIAQQQPNPSRFKVIKCLRCHVQKKRCTFKHRDLRSLEEYRAGHDSTACDQCREIRFRPKVHKNDVALECQSHPPGTWDQMRPLLEKSTNRPTYVKLSSSNIGYRNRDPVSHGETEVMQLPPPSTLPHYSALTSQQATARLQGHGSEAIPLIRPAVFWHPPALASQQATPGFSGSDSEAIQLPPPSSLSHNSTLTSQQATTESPGRDPEPSGEEKSSTFLCRQCGKAFGNKQNLRRHERFQHGEVETFSCSTCGKNFSRKDNLVVHLRDKHGEEYLSHKRQRVESLKAK